MRACVVVVALIAGCADSNAVRCGDVVCPVDSTCGPNNECVPALCGNDELDGSEQCDGATTVMADNLRCTDYGYYGNQLVSCSATCTVDTSVCNGTCGDHELNGPELCDGIPPEGYSCADFGFDIGNLDCSDACSVALESCGALGWRDAAGGATNELRAVWLDDFGNGVAVGLGGTVLRASQGVWSPIPSPTTNDLYGVFGIVDATDPANPHPVVVAVGAGGTILEYANGEITQVTSPVQVDLYAVSGVSRANAYIVGANGTIVKSTTTGWVKDTSPTGEDLYAVTTNELAAVAVGANGTMIREVNGSWAPIASAPATTKAMRAVSAAGNELFVGGDGAILYHFVGSAGGGTWTSYDLTQIVNSPEIQSLFAVRRTATAIDAYIGMASGYIVHWDGTRPVPQTSPTTRSLFGMYGTSASRVVAVTRGGRVIQYSGTDERVVTTGIPVTAGGGVFRTATTAYATQANGWLGQLTNGVWDAQQVLPAMNVTSVWANAQTIYLGVDGNASQIGVWSAPVGPTPTFTRVASAGGVNGVSGGNGVIYAVGQIIQKYDGVQWTVDRPQMGDQILDSVFMTPEGDWFAVGGKSFVNGKEKALVLVKHSGESAWTEMTVDLPRRLLRVWGTSSTDLFAVGGVGMIAHFDGTAWTQMYTGTAENFSALHGSSATDVYAGGANRNLYHYDGLAWTRMTTVNGGVFGIWAEPNETLIVATANPVGLADTITHTQLDREDRCQDAFDNDGDGDLNCADVDCKDSLYCLRGGACETVDRITCETVAAEYTTFTGHARIDDFPRVGHSTPGPEAALRFVADRSGPVTITINDATNLLDLVVLDSLNFGCDVRTARVATRSDGSQSVTFDATAGELYFAVIDGPVSTALPFTVTVGCP